MEDKRVSLRKLRAVGPPLIIDLVSEKACSSEVERHWQERIVSHAPETAEAYRMGQIQNADEHAYCCPVQFYKFA